MISEFGIYHKFFKIIKIGIGSQQFLPFELSDEEWYEIFRLSTEQSLTGITLKAIEIIGENCSKPPKDLLLQWIGKSELIRQRNELVNKQTKYLVSLFKEKGFSNCILKGQGVARLYPEPGLRQPGDIDIWVDGDREDVVRLMRSQNIHVTVVDYVNCHATYFSDTEVEVHFRPTWFYNPFVNKRVQKWIKDSKAEQMAHFDEQASFNYPTLQFNLVFSLIHIYRHVLFEGIGLRQMTDYYYILQHSTKDERQKAYKMLRYFGVGNFVGAAMYIMQHVYGMDESKMLCRINEKLGKKLLDEILRGGNFGQHDDRMARVGNDNRWKRGWEIFKRDMRFIKDYPSEVIWMPIWKIWHYFWRMKRGYL